MNALYSILFCILLAWLAFGGARQLLKNPEPDLSSLVYQVSGPAPKLERAKF
jgi:hypothetical protein